MEGQMTIFDFLGNPQSMGNEQEEKPRKILSVGDRVARVVLGECRVATVTKVEGFPDHPFYRTDRGICYSYEDGLLEVDSLMEEAKEERKKYLYIRPHDLEDRMTIQYPPRKYDGKVLWAQVGIYQGMLYWKSGVTYQFLEPYPDEKALKKAYMEKVKEITMGMGAPFRQLEEEITMERLYWVEGESKYAQAEYATFHGAAPFCQDTGFVPGRDLADKEEKNVQKR